VIPLANIGFMSPDSVCHSFDQRGNGYAKGEGIATMVIKRVSDAIRDGDTIRAVIRGSGTNQDGRTPSISQPSPEAQADLIRRIYRENNLDPGLTRYFEAHGTGTAVGDPIEADAIHRVFSEHRAESDPLYIGAVKSNVGHLEAASGLAGVIKSVLVLERGIIPPIALLRDINSAIPAAKWKLKVGRWTLEVRSLSQLRS
jgi:acyl transferase domain-containing protein